DVERKTEGDLMRPVADHGTSDIASRKSSASHVVRLLWEKVPFLLLSAANAAVTLYAQQSSGVVTTAQFNLLVRCENAAVSYLAYIFKTLWPARLAVFYPHPGDSISGWQAFGACLFLVIVTAAVIWKREHKYLVTGWFIYLGTLVPVIGLVQVGLQARA